MGTQAAVLLGLVLASAGAAQATAHKEAARQNLKPHAERIACVEARSSFIENFSQLISVFHDQVELAEATPRIALSQRVADLQKTALELKNTAIPACALAVKHANITAGRQLAALQMEMAATFAIPGDTTGPAAESMRKALQDLLSSDARIEAICRNATKEKAQDLHLQMWKSDAELATGFEIKRFLGFMKQTSGQSGSFEARQVVVASQLYSVAAGYFWQATPNGRARSVAAPALGEEKAAVGGTAGGVRWNTPATWALQSARPLRVATYGVPAAAGSQSGECGVFYFGQGQNGGVEGNFDRWVKQFEDAAPPKRGEKTIHGLRIYTIDVSGTYLVLSGPTMQTQERKPGYRLMGAIVEAPHGLVFFKCVGLSATIGRAQADFDALLDSLATAPPAKP